MNFTVAIYAGPTSPTARTALEFVRAALAAGHQIYRLFFFSEGAANGSTEAATAESWAQLVAQHALDAVVCVNSAEKQGISIDGKSGRPLQDGFVIGGLGQLVDGVLHADRFITFG